MSDLLDQILGATPPESFALLSREGRGELEVLRGRVVDVDLLAEIPLSADGRPQEVLALVPYRQVGERGYEHHDDGAPLRCLIVEERQSVPLAEAIRRLPATAPEVRPLGFSVSDEDYARTVERVIEEEIGRGEGANFVIRRDFMAEADAPAEVLAPALLRALLERESGAYWTFAVVTPGITLVGASPERHVSVLEGVVTMNPISGTYRHPAEGPDPVAFARFLADVKEVEELFMVVDEELKMMSAVCSRGGHIQGPYLKQMSRVTHTEYLLEGSTDLDVRDVLRETMFAPTVTGSPMENACTVIKRHEPDGRAYYSGVMALISPEAAGGHSLDAPILIRTAQLLPQGRIRVSAGATLVRHSSPEGEVMETHGKASGVLAALGLLPSLPAKPAPRLADDPAILAALERRNAGLAPFWLDPQHPEPAPGLQGRTAVILDAEDRFTTMLAHQLRHFGMQVEVRRWDEFAGTGPGLELPDGLASVDLLVAGPGPGDPEDLADERIAVMDRLIRARRASGRPLLAVCLSHQILATQLGLPIERLDRPRQGLALTVPLFGTDAVIGFYNTFTARVPEAGLPEGVEAAADAHSDDVFALRGDGFASIQGHVESILSKDGLTALESLTRSALGA